jgi:general secretion pathway protein K
MLDQIWQMPFAWPPIVPEGTSAVDKAEIKSTVKKSAMQGTYFTSIESEGGKLDINDLDSPTKAIADSTHQQVMQIFQQQIEADQEFARKYQGFDFEKLVNNMADWIDADSIGRNGGDESSQYENASEFMPPNQPFKTIEELHMVAMMDDTLYNLLAPRLTIFGVKGVNVNYAKREVLMALSPQITDKRADAIIKRRSDPDQGPFKDEKDLLSVLAQEGVNGNPFRDDQGKMIVPLMFDAEYNFRIHSTGRSGRVEREITVVVYDFDRVKDRLSTFMAKGTPAASPTPNPNPGENPTPPPINPTPTASGTPAAKQIKEPNERPNIVYWNET